MRVHRAVRRFAGGCSDIAKTGSCPYQAVVASPIFGVQDEVAGILYGARHRAAQGHIGIRPLEAQIVQLLAGAMAGNTPFPPSIWDSTTNYFPAMAFM